MAAAVVIAVLAVDGWYVTHLAAAFDRGVRLDPHDSGPISLFVTAAHALLLIVPLIGAAGLVMLLLTRATRLDAETVEDRSLHDEVTGNGGSNARPALRFHRLAWEAPPALMAATATAMLVAWALSFLIVLIMPLLTWNALPGVAILIALVDLFGMSHLLPHWAFVILSLVISLLIAIPLYAGQDSYQRPKSSQSGTNGGRS